MKHKRGLTGRLYRDFVLQALYISIAVVVGVLAVTAIIEDVLTKQALRGEADFYWETVAERADLALPETRNMVSYRPGHGRGVPPRLESLEPGFHRQTEPKKALAYVTERNGERLYLVFDSGRVSWLIFWFGVLPLAITLIVIYYSLFQAYRVSSRALSPIIALSKQVKKLDPAEPDVSLFSTPKEADTDDEIQILNTAMQDLTQRLVDFVDRESNFTRDASHELRSPLTVIKMATDKLLQQINLEPQTGVLLNRVKNAATDMEELTEAFLLLARESNQSLPADWVNLNDVVEAEINRTQLLFNNKNLEVSWSADVLVLVLAPEKVLASVIGNLLRNGATYTEQGKVSVTIDAHSVTIADTGPGMNAQELEQIFEPFNRGQRDRMRGGFGVGLTIVQRLCERFSWPLSLNSTPGVGTTVKVTFPNAKEAQPQSP